MLGLRLGLGMTRRSGAGGPALTGNFSTGSYGSPTFTRTGAKAEPTTTGATTAFAANTPAVVSGLGYYSEGAYTNLLVQSQSFNTGWQSFNYAVTADAAAAPDGATTADKVTETAATGSHAPWQNVGFTSGTAYTLSVYMKAGERTWAYLGLDNGVGARCRFDLTNGVKGTLSGTSTSKSATMTALGNGWYRCTLTSTATNTATGQIYVGLTTGDGVGDPSYLGVAGSGAYFWQAQCVVGSAPGPLVLTTAAPATAGADTMTYSIPNGTYTATYTFDDASTQNVPTTVSGGTFTLPVYPTTLNRPCIASLVLA